MRAASVGATLAAGAAFIVALMVATTLVAQQGDNPQTQPSTKVVPSMPRSPTKPRPLVIACSGTFAKDSNHLKLTMAYDLKNVDFGEVDTGSGKTMASIIYPRDPKRRLEVWWSDQEKRKDTYLIVINGHSTWGGPGGLRLGLSVADLEKLNRKSFKVKGFDKGGVASVTDWNGGTLASLPGGCKAGVSLHADTKAAANTISALAADHEFSSADPALRGVNPAVSEILIGY